MIEAILGPIIALFLVMSVPALVTGPTPFAYFARNFAVAIGVTSILLFSPFSIGVNLFLAGFLTCGCVAISGRREGIKLLALEPAMLFVLILLLIIVKEDAGGFFSGRGLGPTMSHLEGELYKRRLPIQSSHFGVFSLGGVCGILASVAARPRLLEKLNTYRARHALRQTRALPEADVFGDRIFAPWRMLRRGQRRLSARIHKVTLR